MKRFYFLPEICSEAEARQLSSYADLIEINKEVYQKLAYRDTTEGVLVVQNQIDAVIRFKITKNPLILLLKPRKNQGIALLRTADAANLDAVLIANQK
jgi:TrmH family RNA methyltransferase